ncbi:MAG: NusG domain II-containing protein [Clostridia bacterium]
MKFINKKDFYLIIPLMIIAVLCIVAVYIFPSSGKVAKIYLSDILVKTVDLSVKGEEYFKVDKNSNVTFYKKDDTIGFLESNCPDKICVNSGMLSKAGQTAACIPNKLFLVITSNNKNPDDVDVLVGQ